MNVFEYPDKCKVRRSDGEVDENGYEIDTDVYTGDCLLELGGDSKFDGFQFEHEPMVFIPINNVMFEINDKVEITKWNGRKLNYTIKNWEANTDEDFEELRDTCIWLKDGHE